VHTLFRSFLPPASRLHPLPTPPHFQAEPVLRFSPVPLSDKVLPSKVSIVSQYSHQLETKTSTDEFCRAFKSKHNTSSLRNCIFSCFSCFPFQIDLSKPKIYSGYYHFSVEWVANIFVFCVSETFITITKHLTETTERRKDLLCSLFGSFSAWVIDPCAWKEHCGAEWRRSFTSWW
jgi:hypothetical protein